MNALMGGVTEGEEEEAECCGGGAVEGVGGTEEEGCADWGAEVRFGCLSAYSAQCTMAARRITCARNLLTIPAAEYTKAK
eukprot:155543-Pelagomonas_calceolata.AAC.3